MNIKKFTLKPSKTCFSRDFTLYGLILACFKAIKWLKIDFFVWIFLKIELGDIYVFFPASVLTDLKSIKF